MNIGTMVVSGDLQKRMTFIGEQTTHAFQHLEKKNSNSDTFDLSYNSPKTATKPDTLQVHRYTSQQHSSLVYLIGIVRVHTTSLLQIKQTHTCR